MSNEHMKSTFEMWLSQLHENSEKKHIDPNQDSVIYDYDKFPELEVRYIERLFSSPSEHLRAYSDEEINKMLWVLVNEIEPYLYELFNEAIPLDLRVQVVKNMALVYEQLFVPRCSNIMSSYVTKQNINQINSLNSICYMWWDIIPLYGKSGESNREVFDLHCLDVMEKTLHLNSIACQEGALHGLGHWEYAYPKQVKAIIDAYLDREKDIDDDLRSYALAARNGMVM